LNTNDSDLNAVYASIRANKAQTWGDLFANDNGNDIDDDDTPADPGFRIYHVDDATGEQREVPPYTSPGEFLKHIQQANNNKKKPLLSGGGNDTSKGTNGAEQLAFSSSSTPNGSSSSSNEEVSSPSSSSYNEKTFDGYTVIQEANSRTSRQEELNAMRAARQKNRNEDTDLKSIGVFDWEQHQHQHQQQQRQQQHGNE
jgi:hypothetical protein